MLHSYVQGIVILAGRFRNLDLGLGVEFWVWEWSIEFGDKISSLRMMV